MYNLSLPFEVEIDYGGPKAFKECIRAALESGGEVREAEVTRRTAHARYLQARSTALPQISFTGAYTRQLESIFSSGGDEALDDQGVAEAGPAHPPEGPEHRDGGPGGCIRTPEGGARGRQAHVRLRGGRRGGGSRPCIFRDARRAALGLTFARVLAGPRRPILVSGLQFGRETSRRGLDNPSYGFHGARPAVRAGGGDRPGRHRALYTNCPRRRGTQRK